jgi:hypothetical protein
MPPGWKLGDASVPFLDTDFFLKRESRGALRALCFGSPRI